MPKLIVTLLLMVVNSSAAAAWVLVDRSVGSGGYTVYVETTTIRRSGDMVKMWHMFDFRTVQEFKGGGFLSSRTQQEYDCKGERARQIYFAWTSGNMGSGEVVLRNNTSLGWDPVGSGTIDENLWKFACKIK